MMTITYISTAGRNVLFALAALQFILVLTAPTQALQLLSFALALVSGCLAFVRYTFVIERNKIHYTVTLFGIKLHYRQANAAHIKKVIFTRTGWAQKCATIHVRSGLRIRVAYFKPETVYEHIHDFCEHHAIDYKETADYVLLQKMR